MDLFNFVKQALPILDLVGEYVQLKHAGNYWKGPCPFHSETDASFTVSPDRQIFYCFGCQATGDVIAFIAKLENLSQIEAVKHLIEQYRIEVPPELKDARFKNLKSSEEKEIYFRAHQLVAEWAHKQLLSHKSAYEYLISRGVSAGSIKTFMLGYFPGGITSMNLFIKDMASQGLLLRELLDSGLLMDGKVVFSAFEERILFPIKDALGRFTGFGGRIFREHDQRPKYLNSKEAEGFVKGRLLFGFDAAKKAIQKEEAVFLVEGYMDCVAMVQHGYPNTVATLGTACTLEHLKILSRFASTLYLLYDGDKAGQAAILRITQLCWQVSIELKVIVLPAQEDPASFLGKQGNLQPLINAGRDIFSFFIDTVSADFINKPLSKKLALAEKIVGVIGSIDDEFKRDLLIQQAAGSMQMPFQSVKNFLESQKADQPRRWRSEKEVVEEAVEIDKDLLNPGEGEISLLEEKIFSAMINTIDKNVQFVIEPELIPYFSQRVQCLLKKITLFISQHNLSPHRFADFLATLEEHERGWVTKVSLKFDVCTEKEVFEQLMFLFGKHNWKQIVRDITEQMREAEKQSDHVLVKELFGKFSKLKQGIQHRGMI